MVTEADERREEVTDEILARVGSFPPEVAQAALYRAIGDAYRASLYKTAKDLCGYEHMTWLTHGPLCQALESETKRKLLVVPRGCFKSSIGVVAYSIWLLLRDPNIRILIDSEKYENSKNFIREIKGKLSDPRLSRIFGDFRGPQWGEGEVTIAQRTRVLKEASITASGVEAGKTGQHYDVIIHDDLNSMENSQTSEGRAKILSHYRMNTSILEPGGIMVIIGTRYAADDVIGVVLDTEVDDADKPDCLRKKSA